MNPVFLVTQLITLLVPIALAIGTSGSAEERKNAFIAALKPQLQGILANVEGLSGAERYDEAKLAKAIEMQIDALLLGIDAFKPATA